MEQYLFSYNIDIFVIILSVSIVKCLGNLLSLKLTSIWHLIAQVYNFSTEKVLLFQLEKICKHDLMQ